MQYQERREKEHYNMAQGQHNGYGQFHEGYGQSQLSRPVYGQSPTMNHRSHGGFLDGLFKGKNSQKGQSGGLGSFIGQHKSQEGNKDHGHGKLLGQHQKKTHETHKEKNGLGMFINNGGEKNHNKKQNEHKKKKKKHSKDGHGSGNESGSSSGSDSD